MSPKMADPAPRLSSRRRRAAKAKGRRAKSSLLVKTCLLFQKRSPSQCHWAGRNHMASSSCKGNQVFSLQLTQYREARTKGRVVSAALYPWGSWFLVSPCCMSTPAFPLGRLALYLQTQEGKWPPQPWNCMKTLSSSTTNDWLSSQSPTSKHQRQRC